MKGKYITLQIMLACLSRPAGSRKNIHEQLKETIAKRGRVIPQNQNIPDMSRIIEMLLQEAKAA